MSSRSGRGQSGFKRPRQRAGKSVFSVFALAANTGQDTTKNSHAPDREKQQRTRNERSREAVSLTDRRFQDNNTTALKGATASRCKHPKLAARRAAAYEESLMSAMAAADASDEERGKRKPEPQRSSLGFQEFRTLSTTS